MPSLRTIGDEPIRVFDFFSGCGGTSSGFRRAGLKLEVGLDFDQDAAATYRKNFADVHFIEDDICVLPIDCLAPWLERKGGPVLFSGCAPCQPFSKQNRQKSSSDPRRSLLGEFGRFVRAWRPDYVFVENVPGMQRLPSDSGPLTRFNKLLKSLGYSVECGVVPASQYGVPQTRERLVLLASLIPGLRLPRPSHGADLLPWSTVREWIGSLPPISAGEMHPKDPDHQAARLSEINMMRIQTTPEGGGRDCWPQELLLDCHRRHSGHTDVYGRLAWDRPASGLTTRCISYSNGRFGHPEQDRAISLREAACLQTFENDYRFVGTLTSRAKQVGNAVPPLMAYKIGLEIKSHHEHSGNKESLSA